MEKRVLIIGSGTCAQRIADNLVNRGIEVIVAARTQNFDASSTFGLRAQHSGSLEMLTADQVTACQGFVGHFDVVFKRGGQKIQRSTSIVVIAEDYERQPNFGHYGLIPSDRVWSLPQIKESANHRHIDRDPRIKDAKVLFLSGLIKESDPVIHEDVMRTAWRLQSNNDTQTYIFTGNLKVAGNGLEALVRDFKKAGGVINKFTEQFPRLRQNPKGGLEIEYLDEITQQQFRFVPDITVVDDTIYPSVYLRHLSDVFELDTDHIGYLQTDNVHRIPTYTNRKGILVAGPSKAALGGEDQLIDADSAALTATGLLYGDLPSTPYAAEIDPDRCARCLACLRLCPHHAISYGPRLAVNPDACEGCGLCATACPAMAIRQQQLQDRIAKQVCRPRLNRINPATPSIVAFCCSRSAAPSAESARCMGLELPAGLSVVEVPCASSISIEHLLSGFAHQAAGVLVMTCHNGNCYSEKGNFFVKNRVHQIAAFLENIRLCGRRIEIHALASNMGREFSTIANQFARRIMDMGPVNPTVDKK